MLSAVLGIYAVINLVNGYRYVGSSKNVQYRTEDHKYYLRKNSHDNPRLQHAWNKYGEENFDVVLLEEVALYVDLIPTEQKYINEKSEYNIVKLAGRPPCTSTRSEESERRRAQSISKAKKGKKLSESHIESLSRSHKGKKQHPELVEKRASKMRGRRLGPHPPWRVELNRQCHIGIHPSDETREKLRQTSTGRIMPRESVERSAEKRRGAIRTPEQVARIVEGTARAKAQKAVLIYA